MEVGLFQRQAEIDAQHKITEVAPHAETGTDRDIFVRIPAQLRAQALVIRAQGPDISRIQKHSAF